MCEVGVSVLPPPAVLQVAEGAVDEAGSELSTGDEEGVNRHQLTPEVGRRGLSDVHWHCHRGDTCTAGEREIGREGSQREIVPCTADASCSQRKCRLI